MRNGLLKLKWVGRRNLLASLSAPSSKLFLSPPSQVTNSRKQLLSLSQPGLSFFSRPFSTTNSANRRQVGETEEGESTDGWEEEEEEAEPQIGDGGDGGGVVLRDVPWGERALSIAREVFLQFGDDMKLFAFRISPRGYIYVRLDKVTNKYGCPSLEEIENFNSLYKKQLDDVGEHGEIPDDLALEVSSPGAERLLKVPDELDRFKDMPMRVFYVEKETDSKKGERDGVFMVDSIESESGQCVWKLANVRENRDAASKGRLLSRKQKDWRLKLPFVNLMKVTLYIEQ